MGVKRSGVANFVVQRGILCKRFRSDEGLIFIAKTAGILVVAQDPVRVGKPFGALPSHVVFAALRGQKAQSGFDESHGRPHSARMLWIFLVVLTVLGGAAGLRLVATDRKHKALGGSAPKALPAGDVLPERGLRELRVNDVLTIEGRDFLCEGMLNYDEDGHRWICGRVVDGTAVQWLLVGLERSGSSNARLLVQDEAIHVSGYPPEALLVGETKYVMDKRGTATCKMHGDLGALSDASRGRPDGHAERCRWWLYTAGPEDAIFVEQFGSDYRVLRGKKIGLTTVELIPGS